LGTECEQQNTITGLTNASGFIRGSLGKNLNLRYVPVLEFILDETAKHVAKINKIIKENDIKGIIIGNPINMDGTSGKSSQSAVDFAKNLSKNITIPITMWDERLSSEGSFKITKELNINVSNRVNKLDKNAAAFILQGAIDY